MGCGARRRLPLTVLPPSAAMSSSACLAILSRGWGARGGGGQVDRGCGRGAGAHVREGERTSGSERVLPFVRSADAPRLAAPPPPSGMTRLAGRAVWGPHDGILDFLTKHSDRTARARCARARTRGPLCARKRHLRAWLRTRAALKWSNKAPSPRPVPAAAGAAAARRAPAPPPPRAACHWPGRRRCGARPRSRPPAPPPAPAPLPARARAAAARATRS